MCILCVYICIYIYTFVFSFFEVFSIMVEFLSFRISFRIHFRTNYLFSLFSVFGVLYHLALYHPVSVCTNRDPPVPPSFCVYHPVRLCTTRHSQHRKPETENRKIRILTHNPKRVSEQMSEMRILNL